MLIYLAKITIPWLPGEIELAIEPRSSPPDGCLCHELITFSQNDPFVARAAWRPWMDYGRNVQHCNCRADELELVLEPLSLEPPPLSSSPPSTGVKRRKPDVPMFVKQPSFLSRKHHIIKTIWLCYLKNKFGNASIVNELFMEGPGPSQEVTALLRHSWAIHAPISSIY